MHTEALVQEHTQMVSYLQAITGVNMVTRVEGVRDDNMTDIEDDN